MNDYNTAWWGRAEPHADLAKKRSVVAAVTARALGVPVEEIDVTETLEPQGVRLVASWWPS